MPEKETSTELDVKIVNRLSIEQKITVNNPYGETIMCHEIYPIGPSPFLSFFDEDVSELESKKYHMFGSVMGFPDTASIKNMPEDLKDSEERFNLYLLAEREFYNQYFKNNKSESGYLRYIHDFAFDEWNRENIYRMVDALKEEGIVVNLELEGENDQGVYHTVLLFEKRDSKDSD